MPPPPARHRIGVFDSGVGGLSVLRAVRRALPACDLLYVADNAYAPYGERGGEFVRARTLAVTDWLRAHGCGLLVVACNTATAWGMDALRARHPGLPVVGVEPGLKPAAALTRNGRIAVLATPATLRSERFERLRAAHADHLELTAPACDGLAAAIEKAEPQDADLQRLLDRIGAQLREAGADTVVLGCTHYPFVGQALRERAPDVLHWVDTADAIARRVAAFADTGAGGLGTLTLHATGSPAALDRMAAQWLGPGVPPAGRVDIPVA